MPSSYRLKDGTSIRTSNLSPAGYFGVSVPSKLQNSSKPYLATVTRNRIEDVDSRAKEIQPRNEKISIGHFEDPRQAAYAVALFMADPKKMIDNWASRTDIDFPDDLYDIPSLDDDQISSAIADRSRSEYGSGPKRQPGDGRGNRRYGSEPDSEEEESSPEDNLANIAKSQSRNAAENAFSKLYQNNPKFQSAFKSLPADERSGAQDDIIGLLMKGTSFDSIMKFLDSYLNESRRRLSQKQLTESKQMIHRLKYLSGLK